MYVVCVLSYMDATHSYVCLPYTFDCCSHFARVTHLVGVTRDVLRRRVLLSCAKFYYYEQIGFHLPNDDESLRLWSAHACFRVMHEGSLTHLTNKRRPSSSQHPSCPFIPTFVCHCGSGAAE